MLDILGIATREYRVPKMIQCKVCGEPAEDGVIQFFSGDCVHEECCEEYLARHAAEYADEFINEHAAAHYYRGWFDDLDNKTRLEIIQKAYRAQEDVDTAFGHAGLKRDRLDYCLNVAEDDFLLYVEDRLR